ncbi:MAG: DVUA0089 family protein, partial [Phycisphaerales bacterium]
MTRTNFRLGDFRRAFERTVNDLLAFAGRADLEALEDRRLLTYMDIIGLTQMRADPLYSAIDGQGVTVAILDTGLDGSHVDLSSNYRGGFDAVNGESTPVDRQGHGTHVAGLVGSSNPTIGVAPRAGVVGVKVLGDNGSGSNRDIAEGLRWVFDNRQQFNIVAVNMSLGGGFYESESEANGDTVISEIRRLERVGVTVVAAGGNSFKNHEYQNFAAPAIGSTIAVGAVWEDTFNSPIEWGSGATDITTGVDRVTSFSQRLVTNYTLFAPGALLRSTTPRNGYEEMGGTSQASPVVAGSVALLQDAALTFAGRLLTPDEVVTTLRATADAIFDGDDENDNVQNTNVSYPRLNIYRAVQRVREQFGNVPPPPPPPGGGQSVPDPNGRISGAVAISPNLDGSAVLSVTGRIGEDGGSTAIGATDVDMFKVNVVSRGNVTFTLSPDTSNRDDFDSYLRLFDANGAELANDDDGGDTGYSRLTQNLQPGLYFIGVSGAPNTSYSAIEAGGVAGDTGTFSLSLSLSNSDPNGLLAGAVEVRLGDDLTPLEFPGFIGADLGQPVGTSDVDLFRVTVPDGGRLLVDIDTPDADGFVDSFLRVFDENGTPLGASDDTAAAGVEFSDVNFPGILFDSAGELAGHTTDSFLSIEVARGGVYYFGVSDFENQSYDPSNLENRLPNGPGGTYQIIVRLVTPDVNGNITQVRNLIGTLPRNGSGTIGADPDSSGQFIDVGDKDVDFF